MNRSKILHAMTTTTRPATTAKTAATAMSLTTATATTTAAAKVRTLTTEVWFSQHDQIRSSIL